MSPKETKKEWFDKNGLLHVNPGEDSDNGILFTVEYYLLRLIRNEFIDEYLENYNEQVKLHQKALGEYWQRPGSTENPGSHDNATAIACFSYLFNQPHHITLKMTAQFLNPRDFIFYNFLKGKFWAKLAMPYVLLSHYVTSKKPREETSGKCLLFVRYACTVGKSKIMAKSWPIIERNLMKIHGKRYWGDIFRIYFKREDHPNVVLSQGMPSKTQRLPGYYDKNQLEQPQE